MESLPFLPSKENNGTILIANQMIPILEWSFNYSILMIKEGVRWWSSQTNVYFAIQNWKLRATNYYFGFKCGEGDIN